MKQSLDRIHELKRGITRPVRIMEVCGTHTVTACRSGLRSLLPPNLQLLSGPGCPVCVTPAACIDKAIMISRKPEVIIATFGDLLRVPGSLGSLEIEKAKGADVRVVYSVLDALDIAEKQKDKKVIFMAVGFETTAPGIAWAVRKAAEKGLKNFALLNALKTMPNAMAALLKTDKIRINGFICPGHVSTIIGAKPYEFICKEYCLPCVIAGFEVFDVVLAVEMLLEQIAAGQSFVQNEYHRSVSEAGNINAKRIIADTFDAVDVEWRGLGFVPKSGLKLKKEFIHHDADVLFRRIKVKARAEQTGCRCGEVLRGRAAPPACRLYGKQCTPATPVGACMVSSEGACAAYYKYEK